MFTCALTFSPTISPMRAVTRYSIYLCTQHSTQCLAHCRCPINIYSPINNEVTLQNLLIVQGREVKERGISSLAEKVGPPDGGPQMRLCWKISLLMGSTHSSGLGLWSHTETPAPLHHPCLSFMSRWLHAPPHGPFLSRRGSPSLFFSSPSIRVQASPLLLLCSISSMSHLRFHVQI